jgi:peptidoglycan/LPS O-acetylase OafA/YrhL
LLLSLSLSALIIMKLLPPSSTKRVVELDVLRGIAIALVILTHLPFDPDPTILGHTLLEKIKYKGWSGVDLFFVLSGFLISGLLFKEMSRTGTIRVGRFLLRRGLKIWPAYYAFFGLLLLYEILKPTWRGGFPDWYLLEPWSLAVEEHFYIALPILFCILMYYGSARAQTSAVHRIPQITGLVCAVVLILRILLYYQRGGQWGKCDMFLTHLRADALMFGVLIGYLHHYKYDLLRRFASRSVLLMFCSLGVLIIAFLMPRWAPICKGTFARSLIYLAYAGLLVGTLFTDWKAFPRSAMILAKPIVQSLRILGIYSYTIYITHYCFGNIVSTDTLRDFLTTHYSLSVFHAQTSVDIIYLCFGISSGILLSHVVERPILRLRERYFPSRSRNAIQDSSALVVRLA